MRARYFARLTLALLTCSALASIPAVADDVYLTNGRIFEGVVAEWTPTQVRIRLAGGELRLPRSQVLRIVEAETPHEHYLRKAEELREEPATTADAWLGLARWARVNGLEASAKEAALVAAELDPRAEGLAPLLRGLGYTFDAETSSWMAHDQYMRSLGYVRHHGEWTTPEEQAQRLRAAEQRRREHRAAVQEALRIRREEERERAELARAVAEELRYQEQRQARARAEVGLIPFSYSVPSPLVVVRRGGFSGTFFSRPTIQPPMAPPAMQRGRFEPTPGPVMNIFERAPGSLIPARGRF